MSQVDKRFISVVLAGGSGLRLWPVSTREIPKQFISLGKQGTLLQETLRRVILINDVWLTFFLSDDTEKQILFKNVLYCRKAFCNFFNINHTVLNNVEFKINKKSINFINENDNFIDWADFKNCHFYLHVNKLMSSISTNLAFIARAGQFINAKLENAKSVKNNMTNQ